MTACAAQQTIPPSDPLLYDSNELAQADSVVIGIPGALTSVRVLRPIDRMKTSKRAVAYFRLPGFDGRPKEESIILDRAAARIARLVQTHDLRRIDLIGHSTGAVIALEAAKHIRAASPNVDVHVSAISTALPAPQPVLAGLRGAAGTVAAAARARSLNPRKVWLEYYRRLAYGPDVDTRAETVEAADALVAANDDRIELPENGLYRRHTRDLRRWTNPDPDALKGAQITFYHGAVDPVFPPWATRRFVDTLPDARVTFIDGHGHLILLTYPQVWDRITSTLNEPSSD
ncbi:alpha/beta hydrolase [uncultured Tateyamaria sp.]|uniref:alpha/beta fold hydrolase n=1 Tax=uncultured Tateyamaria sp. TaxID=455651 RepID=UPI00260DF0D3|nr:alpha/beta hydrolase [uncultured Tateyamaria sp.]